MNYFAHAALAQKCSAQPAFVFGAMLPDLLAMVNARPIRKSSPAFVIPGIQAGVEFHLRTDALFHETRSFVTLNRSTLKGLRSLGVSRGPARACAHIGVELLIDGLLSHNAMYEEGYLDALNFGLHSSSEAKSFTKEEGLRISKLCGKLLEGGLRLHEPSPKRLHFRLQRTLQQRPLLRPSPEELTTIVSYLHGRLEAVSGSLPDLLNEMSPLYLCLGDANTSTG